YSGRRRFSRDRNRDRTYRWNKDRALSVEGVSPSNRGQDARDTAWQSQALRWKLYERRGRCDPSA
ncbi:MAG: hypothetical protein ACYS0H_25490, partial [Planctomycetota bacterium]